MPWLSRCSRAPSLASAAAGAYSEPKNGVPTISTAQSHATVPGSGTTTPKRTPTASATMTGRSAPNLSDSRPAIGDSPDSSTAPHRNVAAITVPLAPSRLRRSGASTLTTPKAMPASAISHIPVTSRLSRSAGPAARRPCGSGGRGAGTANAAAIRATPATEAAENAGPVPIWLASAPTTGPKRAPTTAAPSAMPSSSPRRSSGAAADSQARAAAQVQAPATPWTNRALSSTTALDDHPKASVAALISARPSSATIRSPSLATSTPPGSEPASVPAG
jgi:hypothetical protein